MHRLEAQGVLGNADFVPITKWRADPLAQRPAVEQGRITAMIDQLVFARVVTHLGLHSRHMAVGIGQHEQIAVAAPDAATALVEILNEWRAGGHTINLCVHFPATRKG